MLRPLVSKYSSWGHSGSIHYCLSPGDSCAWMFLNRDREKSHHHRALHKKVQFGRRSTMYLTKQKQKAVVKCTIAPSRCIPSSQNPQCRVCRTCYPTESDRETDQVPSHILHPTPSEQFILYPLLPVGLGFIWWFLLILLAWCRLGRSTNLSLATGESDIDESTGVLYTLLRASFRDLLLLLWLDLLFWLSAYNPPVSTDNPPSWNRRKLLCLVCHFVDNLSSSIPSQKSNIIVPLVSETWPFRHGRGIRGLFPWLRFIGFGVADLKWR